MLKKLSKYFSVFIILILVNSNYSFALTYMICKMNNTIDACSCVNDSVFNEIQFNTMDSGCCKIEIKEINNTNTLEINKISLVKELPFKIFYYFDQTILHSGFGSIVPIQVIHFKPPADISILFSHILI